MATMVTVRWYIDDDYDEDDDDDYISDIDGSDDINNSQVFYNTTILLSLLLSSVYYRLYGRSKPTRNWVPIEEGIPMPWTNTARW